MLAVGHPFGAKARPEPLLSVGLLSRWHPDTASAAWRGQWQTDAAGLDTNSGGAAVDLEGRLLGLFTLWYPARHGRNSGIAFVVPWSSIRGALPDLARGKEPLPALLGVRFEGVGVPRLAAVTAGTAASRAGLRPGDVLVRMDAEEIIDYRDAIVLIGHRCAGDHVRIELERGSERLVIDAVLGPRPPRTAPR